MSIWLSGRSTTQQETTLEKTMRTSIKFMAGALLALSAQAVLAQGKYAQVNGLKMYYEVHGTGKPLVVLHGAFGTAEGWAPLLAGLTKNRQVIIVEQQGHGRTADTDRPLTVEQMADDTAALLKQLNIKEADVFGYSMGGSTAFQLAVRHPSLVRKLAVLGAGTGTMKDTYNPEVYAQFKSITPENFNYPEIKDPYVKVAPDPSKWPALVAKILKMEQLSKSIPAATVKSIKAPTLVMMGDRDGVKLEHTVEIYRLIPNCQLAIFPGADHFVFFMGPDKVLGALLPFLDAPAEAKATGGER
jgi:pimeloyl-ACP methyl ester carboxylesterase